MRIEYGKINGTLEVDNQLALHGMTTDNIVVLSGATLELNGMCGGDLIVEEGGIANVRGTVLGSVLNNGGVIEIYGVVNGKVIENAGQTFIDENARVGN